MIRFQTCTGKFAHRVGLLFRGAFPGDILLTAGQPTRCQSEYGAQQTSRNRWSRADLTAAIGQDAPEAEVSVSVWPPRQLTH
jgi:hypothetical protein